MSKLERLSTLIDFVYRGATEPDLWPDIMAGASQWLGSPKGMLYTPLDGQDQGGLYFHHGLSDFVLNLYKARGQAVDLWTNAVVARDVFKEGTVVISRALGVMTRLRLSDSQVASSLAALDRLPSAVLLMSETGNVLFANQAAAAMMTGADSLRLEPFRAEGQLPEVIVFLPDTRRPLDVDVDLLCRTHGVTPSEARVAVAATAGGSMHELAETRSLGVNTVKSHLKSVYAKTGAAGRSELLRVLLGMASGRG